MPIEFLFYKVKTVLALDLGKIYPLWIELKSLNFIFEIIKLANLILYAFHAIEALDKYTFWKKAFYLETAVWITC